MFRIAQILDICAIVFICLSMYDAIVNQKTGMLFLGFSIAVVSIIFLCVSSKALIRAERNIMKDIWIEHKNESDYDIIDRMTSVGVRQAFANRFIRSYRKTDQISAEREKSNEEFEKICFKCKELLSEGNKPDECNEIHIVSDEALLSELSDGLYKRTWEIWRNNDNIYLYVEKIIGYPSFRHNSPYGTKLPVSQIKYFKQEVTTRNEVRVTGGTVRQDKKTGKVTQTPIKTQNINYEEKKTILTYKVGSKLAHT